MATLKSSIELEDNFSNVLNNITNAVNVSVSTIEQMQATMNTPIDTSSLSAAQGEINQTTESIRQMQDAAANGIDIPEINIPEMSIPEWNSDSLEVFNTTGVERFEQEVQSANNMLNTLNQTQSKIAAQAANTSIFPSNMATDMNGLQTRLQNIQSRMQQIESNPLNVGTDEANAELEQLRAQLDLAVQQQQAMNDAVDNMDVEGANAAYLRLSNTISNTERYIRDNTTEQGQFNSTIEQGTQEANNLLGTIGKMVAAYATTQSISFVLETSDELTSTTARLDLMNDGLQTTDELVNMVYAAAQNARGSFSDMAAVVAKFGNNAGDAFSSSEEVVAFAELVQKQMTIAGASTSEASNAMLQLSQALASGTLRGDELNSIFEQAPNLIQSIADYLEVPIGEIRDMASEGELSADVVKAAIFADADEINAKFEEMPMTWAQVWQNMQNTALMAFQPVLERVNEIANSEAFQNFVNGAIETLAVLANVVLNIFDALATVGSFIADNWSIISPIVYGVAAALAVYYGAQLAANAVSLISKGIHLAMAAAQMVHLAITGALTAATAAETAAQYGLNTALYACPVVWIVVAILAIIAVIYAAVAAINKFAGTSVSATGIICGVFTTAAAFIGNIVIAAINIIIGIFVVLWNFIAAFANFFANVFTDPVGAIARLFFDLVDTILSLLQTLAQAIDTIFGSSLADSVQGWRDSLGSWVDETFGEGEEIMATISYEDYAIEGIDYGDAWDAGYSFGEGIEDTVSDLSLSDLFGSTDVPSADDYLTDYEIGDVSSDVSDIADSTETVADSVDITDEELKYLRDIAEQETVNRYTLAEVNVEQTNNNSISSAMDLDGVVNGLTDAVNEAIDIVTEGVHS